MSDQSQTSPATTYVTMSNATSLPGSEDGPSDSGSPDGQTTALFGQARARASRSRQLGSVEGSMTSAISGQSGENLSASDALQSSLENSLRKRLNGSDLCEVTWKPWTTPWGQSRSKPRARVRINLATDFGLWPRPTSLSFAGSHQPGNSRNMNKIREHVLAMLGETTSGVAGVMAKSGALTPALICSLMEFPIEWGNCEPTETPSRRRSRQSSSKAR